MFDGEIVRNFGLRKFLILDRVLDRDQDRVQNSPRQEFKTESKTKLDLENIHQNFFFFLQKALKCHI